MAQDDLTAASSGSNAGNSRMNPAAFAFSTIF
jgi:hypothetical protein